MARLLPPFTAVLLLIVTGIVHGFWTDRWGVDEAVSRAAANLENIPLQVGDWQGEPLPFDSRDAQDVPGQLYRRYVNQKTGYTLSVALVCGRWGPVCIHTPDVCYGASGYKVGRRAVYKLTQASIEGTFFTADATKATAADQTKLRIFWCWYASGKWMIADNPRGSFAGTKVLYKLYVIRELNNLKEAPVDSDTDPCVEFLRQFLPQVQKTLDEGMPG